MNNETIKEQPIKQPVFLEGFAVSGEVIATFTNKSAVIQDFEYRVLPSLDNPSESVKKLVLKVKLLEDESISEYYPNKTSQRTLMLKYGNNLNEWIGKPFKWELASQMVNGIKKAVLYVEE